MNCSYLATPAFRCYAPARGFSDAQEARQYARQAAGIFRVAYAVWTLSAGRLRCLERFPAGTRPT